MNRAKWLAAVIALGTAGLAAAQEDKEPKLSGFTCCNLHYEGDWISDANWGQKPMIPAGAPIKITDYGRYRIHVEIDGKKMRIGQDYGRAESLAVLARKIVVEQDPKAKIASWPTNVKEAIKIGRITPGMTKEQVRVSLGYPPAHQTPLLDAPQWKYWFTQYGSFLVMFDDKDRVKEVVADPGTRATVFLEPKR